MTSPLLGRPPLPEPRGRPRHNVQFSRTISAGATPVATVAPSSAAHRRVYEDVNKVGVGDSAGPPNRARRSSVDDNPWMHQPDLVPPVDMTAVQRPYGTLDPRLMQQASYNGQQQALGIRGSTGTTGHYQRSVSFNPEIEQVHRAERAMSGSRDDADKTDTGAPDLNEVIDMLGHPADSIRANAAAYLQHVTYRNGELKNRVGQLGAIPLLVGCLQSTSIETVRNACGALKNLCFGRMTDQNKLALRDADGVSALLTLLQRASGLSQEVEDLSTGCLWNLSCFDQLKPALLSNDCLQVLCDQIVIPYSRQVASFVKPLSPENGAASGQHVVCWPTVLVNSLGVLRSVSSLDFNARQMLRNWPDLVDSIVVLLLEALALQDINNKAVENACCFVQNLCYQCQEIRDGPNFRQQRNRSPYPNGGSRSRSKSAKKNSARREEETAVCFGAGSSGRGSSKHQTSSVAAPALGPTAGADGKRAAVLWRPDMASKLYLPLLERCSNPVTLEATVGAVQNLCACDWQPSADFRQAIRRDKGLPIIVELLGIDNDLVVAAAAAGLRNLALDRKNCELIGRYALKELLLKLPSDRERFEEATIETVCAVLATLFEVVKSNQLAVDVVRAGGVDRMTFLVRHRDRFPVKIARFAATALYAMWQHRENHDVYKKQGYREPDFVYKTLIKSTCSTTGRAGDSTLYRGKDSQSAASAVPSNVRVARAAGAPDRPSYNPAYLSHNTVSPTNGSTRQPANGLSRPLLKNKTAPTPSNGFLPLAVAGPHPPPNGHTFQHYQLVDGHQHDQYQLHPQNLQLSTAESTEGLAAVDAGYQLTETTMRAAVPVSSEPLYARIRKPDQSQNNNNNGGYAPVDTIAATFQQMDLMGDEFVVCPPAGKHPGFVDDSWV